MFLTYNYLYKIILKYILNLYFKEKIISVLKSILTLKGLKARVLIKALNFKLLITYSLLINF